MNSIKHCLAAFVLLSGFLLTSSGLKATASQSVEQAAKKKIESCTNQLAYPLPQLKQIKKVHEQTNLTTQARLHAEPYGYVGQTYKNC
jgi:hypothetical protein